MSNKDHRDSDNDKKIRFKSKNDPIKQDPRSVTAHGKSALKKDSQQQNSSESEEQGGALQGNAEVGGSSKDDAQIGTENDKATKSLNPTKEEDVVIAQLIAKPSEKEDERRSIKENGKLVSADEGANIEIKQRSSTDLGRQSMGNISLKDDQMKSVGPSLDQTKRKSNESDTVDHAKETSRSEDDHNDSKNEVNDLATKEVEFSDEMEIKEKRVSDHNEDGDQMPRQETEDKKEHGDENANAENVLNVEVTEEQMTTSVNSIKAETENLRANSHETPENTDGYDSAEKQADKIGDGANIQVSTASANTVQNNSASIVTTRTENLVGAPESAQVTEDTHKTEGEDTNATETPPQGDKIEIPANYDGENHQNENLAEEAGDSRKDGSEDGSSSSLGRSVGSEDLKIRELKNRVRPGKVFVVKGNEEAGGFTVKWAQKRKVLAYKFGSRNTSRFSTLLFETVEQLEKASVRHPSIISGLIHPPAEARGSLLSMYFAGVNAKHIVKDNYVKDAETITDHRDEVCSRQGSPQPYVNYYGRDRGVSPEEKLLERVEQPKAGATAMEPIHYNYPFLTDYDIDHKRTDNKYDQSY